jgi:hypothetical protein
MLRDELFDWRTASLAERVGCVLALGLWLVAFAAFVADRTHPGDPEIHATSQAVFLGAWAALLCLVVGRALCKRILRGVGR